jgi:glyoxylase-like metal-dependent hydrolase (beta-lactamase superfamily II)
VSGVVFTHLHADHVGGIAELCRRHGGPIPVFMTAAQDERTNHTTSAQRALLRDTPCMRSTRLDPNALAPVPGFPGVFVIAAGGHTPGSQIVVVHVAGADRERTYVVTGDIVNHRAGIDADLSKPPLYRALVVPEDEERQRELRHFLRTLAERGATLLVSHDRLDLERAPIARR